MIAMIFKGAFTIHDINIWVHLSKSVAEILRDDPIVYHHKAVWVMNKRLLEIEKYTGSNILLIIWCVPKYHFALLVITDSPQINITAITRCIQVHGRNFASQRNFVMLCIIKKVASLFPIGQNLCRSWNREKTENKFINPVSNYIYWDNLLVVYIKGALNL